MSFYPNIAQTATNLIGRFGAPVTVRRAGTTADPVTGAGATTGATVTPVGVVRSIPDRLVDGTRILAGDREVVFGPDFVPDMTDTVRLDGRDWRVVDIVQANPAGVPLAYMVRVR